jgi:ABC-type multidrug transport system ATPase subunit
MSAVLVKSVTRQFGDLVAVDKLSFDVAGGELFGLLGPNGAGKTTVINLITGMLIRDEGEIRVFGHDPQIDKRFVRQSIGFVPQDTNIYQDLNAVDNLWHHAALYNDDLSLVRDRIRQLLDMMNLWQRRKDPVRTFSGGMKRRLVLARALLHDPPLIFFDEPTLGVDVQGKHVIWQHIKDQQAQGKTFIVSTNDLVEAEILCDRLVILDHGRAIALDTPDSLKAALARDIIHLQTSPEIGEPELLLEGFGAHTISRPEPNLIRLEVADAEAILGELVARVTTAHRLESVRMDRPTLDDVFLHHTGHALRE